MITILLGAVAGMTIGVVAGGGLGLVLGALCGAWLGFMWTTVQDASTPVEEGTPVEREQQRVLCVGRGQQADCTFVRDKETHRWVDVESCTLVHPPTKVDCLKRCLVLMNDSPGSA
jgi:hypothetical protein